MPTAQSACFHARMSIALNCSDEVAVVRVNTRISFSKTKIHVQQCGVRRGVLMHSSSDSSGACAENQQQETNTAHHQSLLSCVSAAAWQDRSSEIHNHTISHVCVSCRV